MKHAKILVALILALSLVLCLAACGKDSNKSGGASGDGLAGKYTFHSMSAGGQTVTAEDLAALGEPVEIYITLNGDGTGLMYSEGETEDMVYADGQIWPVGDPDDKADFSVKGSTLTISSDGTEMIFKK